MDINLLLEQLRNTAALRNSTSDPELRVTYADEIIDTIKLIDEKLRNGEPLPRDWSRYWGAAAREIEQEAAEEASRNR